jgi:hypothetical protein
MLHLHSASLRLASAQLQPLFRLLEDLYIAVTSLKTLGSECRNAGVGLSAAQVARLVKVCDLLEALPTLTFPLITPEPTNAPNSTNISIYSLLPDYDTLNQYLGKLRIKARAIEDVASSKKNETLRFKARINSSHLYQVHDLRFIRTHDRQLLEIAEKVELEMENLAPLIRSFSQYKSALHLPLLALLNNLSEQDEDHTPLVEELQHLADSLAAAQKSYSLAQEQPSLVEITNLRREMMGIEEKVRDLVRSNSGGLSRLIESALAGTVAHTVCESNSEMGSDITTSISNTATDEELEKDAKLLLQSPDLSAALFQRYR